MGLDLWIRQDQTYPQPRPLRTPRAPHPPAPHFLQSKRIETRSIRVERIRWGTPRGIVWRSEEHRFGPFVDPLLVMRHPTWPSLRRTGLCRATLWAFQVAVHFAPAGPPILGQKESNAAHCDLVGPTKSLQGLNSRPLWHQNLAMRVKGTCFAKVIPDGRVVCVWGGGGGGAVRVI